MDFSTLLNLGLLGTGLYDKLRERREAEERAIAEATAMPPPVVFSDQQVAFFTRAVGPHRAFDHAIAEGILEDLTGRCLAPAPDPQLAQYGRAWIVIPWTEGYPTVPEVLGQAFADPSVVVLGSHSLIMLQSGSLAPMVIVVGPPSARFLALGAAPDRHGGVFAIIERPTAPEPVAETAPIPAPEPPPVPAASPEPFPPAPTLSDEERARLAAEAAPKNGAARPNGIAIPAEAPGDCAAATAEE